MDGGAVCPNNAATYNPSTATEIVLADVVIFYFSCQAIRSHDAASTDRELHYGSRNPCGAQLQARLAGVGVIGNAEIHAIHSGRAGPADLIQYRGRLPVYHD